MYKIYEDSVVLFQEALIVKNYQTRFENRRTDTSNYVHLFCKSEKKILDSIIKVNKLDNISMYEKRSYWGIRSIDSIYIKLDSTEFYSQRWPQWGKSWNVKIKRDYITYSIDLPNYHNSGLEDLLIFVSSLIPEKKKGKYMKY